MLMVQRKLKYFEKHLLLKKSHSHKKIHRRKTQNSQTFEEAEKQKKPPQVQVWLMADQYNLFNYALDNPDCRGIPMNCLKNLGTEVKTKLKTY